MNIAIFIKLPNVMNITQPIIKKGPKGISAERFLVLFINDGATVANAIKDEKKITIGMLAQPNQKPIADSNLASPKPMPSLFLIFLYKNIISHMIKYPANPPIIELI